MSGIQALGPSSVAAGWVLEQPGDELVPTWYDSIASSSVTCFVTVPALMIVFSNSSVEA